MCAELFFIPRQVACCRGRTCLDRHLS
jgi:hypothetical protein